MKSRRARLGVFAVLVAAALPTISGCRTLRQVLYKEHVPCGVYRWSVKTLTDPDAVAIGFEPIDATIHDLVQLPRPGPDHRRRTAEEFSVYRVRAVLYAIHTRLDQDVHLLLRDPEDPDARLIAEIPKPECARGSLHAAAFAAARETAELLGARGGETLAEVEGVGFFDVRHVQIGKAQNGFELHPVLKLTEIRPSPDNSRTPGRNTRMSLRDKAAFREDMP